MKAKSLIASLFLALAVFTAAASCVKFDDSEIQSELTDIKSRLSKLEEKVNTNIAGLWEIVNAQKNGIQITSVSETDDTWIISFSNGKTATVSKGKSPVIGVARHQGVYYWTLDDEWLLDATGNKLPVSGVPGTTPQLKIDGGYWYVSTDDGKTWTKLGKATGEDGDSFFKEVTWDDDYVYLTLQNGTKFELRRGDGLVASIAAIPDYSDGAVKAGTSLFTIRFKVEPESAAESLLYLDTDCFKLSAAYTLTKAAAGDLATLPIYEMEANDGILTILTDGEALADEFAKGKLGVSAALFICDGETLSVNSGYFPLYPKNEYLGYEYVDLGLSVKWATINVGATNPEDYGDYYAWGETETKEDYSWLTYKFRVSGDNFDNVKFDKYCSRSSFWGGTGAMDNKTVLDLEDDAANVQWGGSWRMPTDAEFTELRENCTWTWTNNYNGTGIKGRIVTSKKAGYTDKSIFLPSAGRRDGTSLDGVGFGDGYYWSSTLYTDKPSLSCYVLFSNNIVIWNNLNRIFGMPVRPVLGKYVPKSVKGVSLDRGTLTMVVGSTRQLSAKVEPADIKNPKLRWTSSDPGVATVAKDGTVTAVSVGTTTVTVKTVDGGFTATCAVTVISPSDVPAPEAVDLGLSVKWANVNVGAISPEDYGDEFAWGETEPKKEYSWLNYKFELGTDENGPFSKYVTNSSYGTVDNKTVLDPEDDAAHVNWGGSWRMPTDAEWAELRTKCTWTRTSEVNGMLVTGPNGKSIFLPAAGDYGTGLYWSSSFPTDYDPYYALGVFYVFGQVYRNYGHRYHGYAVRPVYGEFIPVKSISLDKTSLELNAGDKQQLTATLSPSNATAKDVLWISSDKSIAKVDQDGLVTAVAPGTATITAYGSSGVSASCTVTVKIKGAEPEYVDLGLPSGTKWATFNVGATKPEDYGDYFAWGETEPKSNYAVTTYKLSNGTWNTLTKYNFNSSYGTVDNKTVLDPEDDAAHVNWGGSWRMPTDEEWTELRDNCTWTWTTEDGVKGSKLTGPNGKSIFLPAAGDRDGTDLEYAGFFGYYWSSSLYTGDPVLACLVYFSSGNVGSSYFTRYYGRSVRPVYGEFIPVASISLDKTSLELNAGDKQQLTATVSPSNATAKDVHWISSDESIAKVDGDGLVTAVAPGTVTITAYASNGLSASCTVTVQPKPVNPEYVDLGLSVKWATFNVGASKPEDYGDYFAWGETEPKATYTWNSYKFLASWGSWESMKVNKYCQSSNSKYWGGPGTPDNKDTLESQDDVAHVKWGGNWRMPTYADYKELKDNCTWTWTDNYKGTGTAGQIVTSNIAGHEDKSIFLPAAGHYSGPDDNETVGSVGYYWSSSLRNDPRHSYYVEFGSNGLSNYIGTTRDYGNSVRPVYGEFVPVSSISLDKPSLELQSGEKAQLTATVSPSNATAKDVHWESSDESIAKVDGDGLVTAVAPGTVTITAYGSSGVSASCTVTVKEGVQAVDLGLPSGLKWASCNVGATKPEEYGDYFAWGETETKTSYVWSTYRWGNGDWDADEHLSKYNTDPSCGNVDGNTMLLPEDDVAQDKWKGGWRMPTDAEWTELRDYCTWTWTVSYEETGVAGYIVEGTKNSSIFLPATGHMEDEFLLDPGVNCGYWSSNIDPDNPAYAWFVYFEEGGVYRTIGPRKYGYSVRPVTE